MLALNHLLVAGAALGRMATAHLRNLVLHVAQVGGDQARLSTDDVRALRLELVIPFEHECVETGLGAAVGDGLEVNLLWPTSFEQWS